MSALVALLLILGSLGAAAMSAMRSLRGSGTAPNPAPFVVLQLSASGWAAAGLAHWAGGRSPSQPGVLAGYLVCLAIVLPVGWRLAGAEQGRWSDAVRAVALLGFAVVVWRIEAIWLAPR